MASDDSIMRQRAKDAAYLRACREHGIEPDAPSYIGSGIDADDLDYLANIGNHGDPVPLDPLTPEAEAAGRLLDILIPLKPCARTFVQTAGRRCLALAWLLGRRPEPLSELARQLGMTRASLSRHARTIEDRTGLHGRGQKGHHTVEIYRRNAKRSWKLRRLNKALADAVADKQNTPAIAGEGACEA